MRISAKLFVIPSALLLATAMATLSRPTAAQQRTDATQPKPIVKSANVDLNGDGKADKITFKATNEEGAFALTVNGTTLRDKIGDTGEPTGGFRVIDIESGDRMKEIVVVNFGANDYNQCVYYRYNGKRIRRIGDTPFDPGNSGSVGAGFVYGDYWMGFWARTDKYALNAKTGLLARVPQEFYFVDKKATVTKSFSVYRSRTSGQILANVAKDSRIVVVLHAPPSAVGTRRPEARQWYLIKTERGLLGWAYFSDLESKTSGLPFAG